MEPGIIKVPDDSGLFVSFAYDPWYAADRHVSVKAGTTASCCRGFPTLVKRSFYFAFPIAAKSLPPEITLFFIRCRCQNQKGIDSHD
jgi:hypothetical protein